MGLAGGDAWGALAANGVATSDFQPVGRRDMGGEAFTPLEGVTVLDTGPGAGAGSSMDDGSRGGSSVGIPSAEAPQKMQMGVIG